MPVVRKNEAASRYELLLDDGVTVAGFADYVLEGARVRLPHTVVHAEFQGQGLAALLAQAALRDIEAAGLCVAPECSYIETYIQRHPQWQALRCAN